MLKFIWWVAVALTIFVYAAHNISDDVQFAVRPFKSSADLAILPPRAFPPIARGSHNFTGRPTGEPRHRLQGSGIRAAVYRNPNAPVRAGPG